MMRLCCRHGEQDFQAVCLEGGDVGLEWDLGTVKPHSSVLLEKCIYGFLLMGGKAPSAAASYPSSLGSVNNCFLEAPKLQILKLVKNGFLLCKILKL